MSSLCTHCNLFVFKNAPAIKTTTTDHKKSYFGAHAKEPSLRLLGSSGGIFPLLARHVLQQGGVVYAPALWKTAASPIKELTKIADLTQITRTKYVQSDLSNIWAPIRSFLHEGVCSLLWHALSDRRLTILPWNSLQQSFYCRSGMLWRPFPWDMAALYYLLHKNTTPGHICSIFVINAIRTMPYCQNSVY